MVEPNPTCSKLGKQNINSLLFRIAFLDTLVFQENAVMYNQTWTNYREGPIRATQALSFIKHPDTFGEHYDYYPTPAKIDDISYFELNPMSSLTTVP